MKLKNYLDTICNMVCKQQTTLQKYSYQFVKAQLETSLKCDSMPRKSLWQWNCVFSSLSQVGGASLDSQAAPATGAGVVGMKSRRSEAWVFRLNRGIRVSQGPGVVEPHRWADSLSWSGRRTGESRGLCPQWLWMEVVNGWLLPVVVGVNSWDGEAVTTQSTRRGAVFTLGCIYNILG